MGFCQKTWRIRGWLWSIFPIVGIKNPFFFFPSSLLILGWQRGGFFSPYFIKSFGGKFFAFFLNHFTVLNLGIFKKGLL